MSIVDLIKHHEGFVSHAYTDSLGYLTIGYGRLIDRARGGGITVEEAEHLLRNDIERTEHGLDAQIPWWRNLSPTRRLALVDMAFNLGVDGLLTFRKMLAALEDGDYHRAATEALDSRWADQVGRRAEDVAFMLENDQEPG